MNTIESKIFLQKENLRFTQDSPIYPEVWKKYFADNSERIDLIFTPYRGVAAAELLNSLKKNLSKFSSPENLEKWKLSSTGEVVVAWLTLEELVLGALPLTKWWRDYLFKEKKDNLSLIWLKELLEFITDKSNKERIIIEENIESDLPITLWSVSLNRPAFACLYESVPATKADAARRVFDIDASDITWAVLDTGIDAMHNGFRKIDSSTAKGYEFSMGKDNTEKEINNTRILETYDFTRFRELISDIYKSSENKVYEETKYLIKDLGGFTTNENKNLSKKEINDQLTVLNQALKNGRMLDWSVIGPFLRIPHNLKDYERKKPEHSHGTHVAGILGANDITGEKDKRIIGMCPNINLIDIRVLDNKGQGEEFNILAAIQFVRWVNSKSDAMKIHGINLSLSMIHDVANYAAGRTPVCEACQRLVSEGTVVVVAAGNLGQSEFQNTGISGGGAGDGVRTASITDPGNAESVITVGSTHRSKPHTYGVSYFSSKGPTSDGRYKPDLVAPGEKIKSLVINDSTDYMDGSSMASPHVSGAAALLLSKHKELIGQPQRIKEILCKTATDLGRERYFQGYGMLDVLRALQSV